MAALIGVLTIALLWPAVVNRSPIIDPDTLGYMQVGEHALQAAGSALAKLAAKLHHVSAAAGGSGAAPAPMRGDHFSPDRSAYYGVFAASQFALGGLWLVAVCQSLIAAITLSIGLRRLGGGHRLRMAVIGLLVAAVSGLAPLASVLMPDVFAGLMLLGIALLSAPAVGLSRLERGFLYALVLASVLFHAAHLLLAAAMVVALIGLGFFFNGVSRRTIAVLALVVALGAAGMTAVNVAAAKLLHTPVVPKPFLLARMQADGPAAAYLHDHCATKPFTICKYRDRLPEPSNTFLWSLDPKTGVIGVASLQDQEAILRETGPVVWGAVREHPLAQVQASAANALAQFVTVGVSDYNTMNADAVATPSSTRFYPAAKAYVAARTPNDVAELEVMSRVMSLAYFLSLAILAGFAVSRFTHPAAGAAGQPAAKDDGLLLTLCVVVIGAICNALICGVLSGVFDRYQGSVAWPVVLVAGLVTARVLTRPGASDAPG